MTQNATTAAARFIPAQGLTHTGGTTTVTAFWVNGAGWKVQVSAGGLTVTSQLHQHEHVAVAEYNALVAQYPAPLADGDQLACRAGNAVVTLTVGRTYAVVTTIGATVADDWSRSYNTETEARRAARHVAVAFRAHGTDVAIEQRAETLRMRVRDLLHVRRPTDRQRFELAAVEAELDTLATLAELAALTDLTADLAA